MATPPRVIDWDEAMEQCGDDEEFLRELLADLRGETDAQVAKIEETIRSPTESPFHRIMRASHVIKGAASNLMCDELRTAAMHLEQAASAAHDLKNHATQAQTAFGSTSQAPNVFGSITQTQQANDMDPSSTQQAQQVMGNVQARYMELKAAVANYHEFLKSISV